MTVAVKHNHNKILLEIDRDKLENLLDIGGFYNKTFLDEMKRSDEDIKKGRSKKRRTLSAILND